MGQFLNTLVQDAENIIEADLPSSGDVRKVLAALIKRVEQLAGVDTTVAPERPPEPAQAAEPTTTVQQLPPVPSVPVEPTPAASTPDATNTAASPDREAQISELKAELAKLEEGER